MKKYILVAGVNGAGKSTLYQSLQSLHDIPRVNTDEILREIGDWRNMIDVMTAGKMAVRDRKLLICIMKPLTIYVSGVS